LYEQFGRPAASAVARKNMSAASISARSSSLTWSRTRRCSMRSARRSVSKRRWTARWLGVNSFDMEVRSSRPCVGS